MGEGRSEKGGLGGDGRGRGFSDGGGLECDVVDGGGLGGKCGGLELMRAVDVGDLGDLGGFGDGGGLGGDGGDGGGLGGDRGERGGLDGDGGRL